MANEFHPAVTRPAAINFPAARDVYSSFRLIVPKVLGISALNGAAASLVPDSEPLRTKKHTGVSSSRQNERRERFPRNSPKKSSEREGETEGV